ncbi:AEC family transporter [Nonomuraea sp. NPDC047897]|uniref:AEC family transporter n=1 Tax=Nonomuraea sp. NPDC047897 TaxID=3364346 RepID=UPI00371BC822
MSGVVAAFVALVSVAVLGFVVGRAGVLRAQDELVLSRLAFFVAMPALLFATVSAADLRSVFSPVLLTNLAGVVVTQLVFVTVARFAWRRSRGEVTIGALASSYINAGNLGIPVGVYVLGDGALVAPILLTQLLVITPAAFLLLDGGRRGARRTSVREALLRPLRNPLTVASLLGLAVAATGTEVPAMLMRPVELVGGAAVPLALLAYGLSLSGSRPAAERGRRRELVLVVLLKNLVQPAVAYLAGRYVLGLDGTDLMTATLFAALPTAQNIYVYAVHYDTARPLARGAVLATTVLSIPIMTAIVATLG